MTDEEPKFLKKVDGRTVDKKGNSQSRSGKSYGKDIVALWRAELKKARRCGESIAGGRREADKKKAMI